MSLLGFGALGKYALAELPQPAQGSTPSVFSSFTAPIRKAGVSVAVAAAFTSFVPPPQAQATPQFTAFQPPIKARTVQQQAWLNTPFVPAQAAFSGFLDFGKPVAAQAASSARRPAWSFAPTPPATVPFSGFFEFRKPVQRPAVQLASIQFEVLQILPPQIGGTSRKLIPDEPPKHRRKTGLEPVKKRPPQPVVVVETKLPLPPFRDLRIPIPETLEPLELAHAEIPGSFLELQAQIHAAEDASDVEKFLAQLEQDEQDAADIADVIALLEAEDDDGQQS